MHTKSKPLGFITIHKLTNHKKKSILKVLRTVITMYLTRGFIIMDVYGDKEFDVEDYDQQEVGIIKKIFERIGWLCKS